MAYCTIDDVQAQLSHLTLTTSTKPTLAQVTQWISDIGDGDMLARLRGVLTTSDIDTTGEAFLKNINVYGVVARVYKATRSLPEVAQNYQDLYDSAMDAIVKNPAILITKAQDRGPASSTAPDVVFHRNTDEW